MTVATQPKVPKAFPARGGAPQILWILKHKGPKTVWELYDLLRTEKNQVVSYKGIRTSLMRLRDKDHAFVINWKEERRRQKTPPRYRYYGKGAVGAKLKGTEDAEVWAIANATT